jgi:hypothetical protein
MPRTTKNIDITTTGEGQIALDKPIKSVVNSTWSATQVLDSDAAGQELYFESDKGKFLALSDETVNALSHDNKVRYSFAAEFFARHNPEHDVLAQQLAVKQARSRRAEVLKEMKEVPSYQLERRMMQAYVGEGYQERWVRTDNIERAKMNGYDFVKADDEGCMAGAPSTGNHYETKKSDGHTEGVLMRISREDYAKHDADRLEKTRRQQGAATQGAMGELTRLGGQPFNESKLRGQVAFRPIEISQE